MFTWNLCHGILSTTEQNEIIALLLLLLILYTWDIVLVFLLLTLNMYLFSVFDLLIFQSFLEFHAFIERIPSK